MKMIVFVALLAAAGCSKKAPDCEGSIGKGMDSFAASIKTSGLNPQMQAVRIDVATKLRRTLTQRCTEDAWPAEVVSCFATVATMKDMQACQANLSNEQRTKLVTEIRQIMMGSSSMRMPGSGGIPGHPPTLAPGGPGGPGGTGMPEASGGGTPGANPGPAPAPAGSAAAPAGSGAAPASPPAPAAAGPAAGGAPAGGAGSNRP